MTAGKWLIIGIFGLAVASGLASWVHRYYRADEVRKIWGTKRLDLIANAPHVGSMEPGSLDSIDITAAKGMLSIRYMLSSDFSYAPIAGESIDTLPFWTLSFRNGGELVRFEFTSDCTLMWTQHSPASITQLVPDAAANLRAFFEEQFPRESDPMHRSWNVDDE